MKDYNRLIQRDEVGAWSVITPELIAELRKLEETKVSQNTANQLIDIIANRLADLEDKIENGTLIELPFMQQTHQGIWEVFFFNTRINGVMYYLFTDKAKAEAMLLQLKGDK